MSLDDERVRFDAHFEPHVMGGERCWCSDGVSATEGFPVSVTHELVDGVTRTATVRDRAAERRAEAKARAEREAKGRR